MTRRDYTYYEGNDIPRPTKPAKPLLPTRDADSDAYREYAYYLDTYKVALAKYNTDMANYHEAVNARHAEFREVLRQESGLNENQFSVLYNDAYMRGHADGFYYVEDIFDELLDMVREFNSYSK